MNINKPRTSVSVCAAILLAVIGGVAIAYLTYYFCLMTGRRRPEPWPWAYSQ